MFRCDLTMKEKQQISVNGHWFNVAYRTTHHAIIETEAYGKQFYSVIFNKSGQWLHYRGSQNTRTEANLKRLKGWINKHEQ